jgi:RNA polymerase sigma-70 factor (ECF subfamily)
VDFDEWYMATQPRLATALHLAFGELDLAQEAADEAMTRACERWARVAGMSSPAGWVFQVGFNVARRRLRRRGFEQQVLRRRWTMVVDAPAGEMWELVAGLPSRQRQAVVLRHIGQLREREIAETMGITRGAVSSTLRAAYASLRTEIAGDQLEEEVR